MSILILILGLAALIHVPLALPNRHIPYDEIVCVDSAIGALKKPYVPRAQFWSHVLPEIGKINFLYSPLSYYALALFLRLVGLRPLAAGLLYMLLRLTSTWVIWAAGYEMGIPGWINGLLTLVWTILCVGPVGRPDDLALLFILVSYYFAVSNEPSLMTLALAGVLVGLSLLTYPGMAILLPVIGVSVLIWRSLTAALETVVIMGMLGGLISLLWLIWIIPFWHEFKTIFLDFALPDARAVSRRRSLSDTLKWLVQGVYGSPIPFHYSVLPVSLLCLVALVQEMENGFLHPLIVLMTFLGFGLYLSSLRIHKNYNLLPLIVTIVWFSQVMLANNASNWRGDSIVYLVFGTLLGYQILASVCMSLLKLLGTYTWYKKYGLDIRRTLLEQIPPGEKVITDIGQVFYALRSRNPIFAPAGLHGNTPGQVTFTTQYDDSFRWLVLAEPLTRDDINPGGKFSWNGNTFAYFRQKYLLKSELNLANGRANSGIARFAGQRPKLWLYHRTDNEI